MKASLKLREEQPCIMKAKLPLKVAGIPMVSGITMGDTQDLQLHVATSFLTGPSCKIAYRPNNSIGAFWLIMKSGWGSWGSPNSASLAMTAEFNISGNSGTPFFSFHLKPRFGDFSIRKHAISAIKPSHSLVEHTNSKQQPSPNSGLSLNGTTPLKLEKGDVAHVSYCKGNLSSSAPAASLPVQKSNSPTADSTMVIGSNFPLKIEGLERQRKSKPKDQHGSNCEEDCNKAGHVEQIYRGAVARVGPFHGWSMKAHSSLPLGNRVTLDIQWGLKLPSELCQTGLFSFSPFSLSKLPFLFMDKISIKSDSPPKQNVPFDQMVAPLPYKFLPFGLSQDSHEMLHLTDLCYSIKRRLCMVYADNKILRKAIEELNGDLKSRAGEGPWKPYHEILPQQEDILQSDLLDNQHKNHGKNDNFMVESTKNEKPNAGEDAL